MEITSKFVMEYIMHWLKNNVDKKFLVDGLVKQFIKEKKIYYEDAKNQLLPYFEDEIKELCKKNILETVNKTEFSLTKSGKVLLM